MGATAGELKDLARHYRSFSTIRQEPTTPLKETIELMRRYGVVQDPEFGSAALSQVVPADDARGQAVLHDLRQFEADLREAAQRLEKEVPPVSRYDAVKTADNAFAWVNALQSGMLD